MTNDRSNLAVIDILPPELREDAALADIAAAVRGSAGTAIGAILGCGELLEDARQKLSKHKNGIYWRWVESECGISKNTAQRWMRAFRKWGEVNRATVARLEISALYLLSSPSCPPEATEEAEQIASDGDPITNKLARDLVAKYTEPKEPESITAIELINSIRRAMQSIYSSCPEELRSIVAPKFRDFADELERTGDLSW